MMQCKDCLFWSKERRNTPSGLFADCQLPVAERWWTVPAYPCSGLATRLDFGCVQFVCDSASHATFGLMESPERCPSDEGGHERGREGSFTEVTLAEVKPAAG